MGGVGANGRFGVVVPTAVIFCIAPGPGSERAQAPQDCTEFHPVPGPFLSLPENNPELPPRPGARVERMGALEEVFYVLPGGNHCGKGLSPVYVFEFDHEGSLVVGIIQNSQQIREGEVALAEGDGFCALLVAEVDESNAVGQGFGEGEDRLVGGAQVAGVAEGAGPVARTPPPQGASDPLAPGANDPFARGEQSVGSGRTIRAACGSERRG